MADIPYFVTKIIQDNILLSKTSFLTENFFFSNRINISDIQGFFLFWIFPFFIYFFFYFSDIFLLIFFLGFLGFFVVEKIIFRLQLQSFVGYVLFPISRIFSYFFPSCFLKYCVLFLLVSLEHFAMFATQWISFYFDYFSDCFESLKKPNYLHQIHVYLP